VRTCHACVQGGFYLKAVVVAVSSFQHVLFLDADNVPISDPTPLFSSAEFKETGVLLWRDYWDASWAPDAPSVLQVNSSAMPPHTHDSGQMLFDKPRCVSHIGLHCRSYIQSKERCIFVIVEAVPL
jgi:hypothetical protein